MELEESELSYSNLHKKISLGEIARGNKEDDTLAVEIDLDTAPGWGDQVERKLNVTSLGRVDKGAKPDRDANFNNT